MAAPKRISNRKIALILTAVTIASTGGVMGSAYLVYKATGMLYDIAVFISMAVFAGLSWLFMKQVVYKRIDRHYDRYRQDREQALRALDEYRAEAARLAGEAADASTAGNHAGAAVARARLVAALVKWRAALPDDWPVAAQVDEMLASAWPDTDELAADSEPDAIVAYFIRQQDDLAQMKQITDAMQYGTIVLGDAAQTLAEAVYDLGISRQGGFNDPDKAAAVVAANAAFEQALDDIKFMMIAKADELAESNPKVAARLAKMQEAIAKVTPGNSPR